LEEEEASIKEEVSGPKWKMAEQKAGRSPRPLDQQALEWPYLWACHYGRVSVVSAFTVSFLLLEAKSI
jgi:hypothetical protein